MAPQSAQSRSTGQILQHTAVVLAGMASIGLTVAAGTYIVNQMGGAGLPAVIGSGDRNDTKDPAAEPDRPGLPVVTPRSWGLAAESRQFPIASVAPATVSARPAPAVTDGDGSTPTAAAHSRGLGGRLNLTGDTFVGANLARTQQHSLTVTFDTNVPAALGATAAPERTGDPAITEFRTDFDVRSGEFSVAMTDPLLGRHDVQVQRHARPAQLPADHPQQVRSDDTGAAIDASAPTPPAEPAPA